MVIFDGFCLDIIGEFGVFLGDHFNFSELVLMSINLERDEWERNSADGLCNPVTISASVKGGK